MKKQNKDMNEKTGDPMPGKDLTSLDQLICDIEAGFSDPGFLPGADDKKTNADLETKDQYIRFTIGGFDFAVPLKTALEVDRLPGITPLPNLPAWVLGISNIRGEIVSIVDLAAFWHQNRPGTQAGDNMILLHHGDLKIGFKVDGLKGIVLFSDEELDQGATTFLQESFSPYLSGTIAEQKVLIHLIDVEKLLTSESLNAFRKK